MTAVLNVVAECGERIYRKRYKAEYERSKSGQFLAIDVEGERVFVADTPEDALQAALDAIPQGRFHLIQVGATAVFKVAYSRSDEDRCDRARSV
jgi:hypothetical protein